MSVVIANYGQNTYENHASESCGALNICWYGQRFVNDMTIPG